MSIIDFAIVIHSNNALEIASKSLTKLFLSFKISNPTPEEESEKIKSTDKHNYGNTFIDYKFIMHKTINNHGRVIEWYEYNGSNKQPNKWNEIKQLTIYPNKKNTNATMRNNTKHIIHHTPRNRVEMATNGHASTRRKTFRSAAKSRPRIIEVKDDDTGWWDATPNQQIAYIKFLKDPHDTPGIVKITLDNGEYFKFKHMNNGQNERWHEIQDRTYPNKWRRIQYVNH